MKSGNAIVISGAVPAPFVDLDQEEAAAPARGFRHQTRSLTETPA
jgi:hypothetical protein